ncbi:MAG: ATP-binding cassette domain-containing protein [Mycobacterium sp.]|nr:ATP-binding cassette domain-containing protein [Mycobacterium sp.]
MADLHVAARCDRRRLDVSFDLADGEVLAVLGPNGAGKSSIAAIIAGLLYADSAVVRIGNRTLTDTSRGVFVPVSDRQVGLLAQDPLLFPHMSVLGNVAFAARRRAGRRGARHAAIRWLESLGVSDLAACTPAQLSGGQAQRVALVRALAAEPEVLVLDEPLSRLDVSAGFEVRSALRNALDAHRVPTILITHDLTDVVELADRVLVLEAGAVAEAGRTVEVLAAPRSAFGARFAGLNVVPGVVVPGVVVPGVVVPGVPHGVAVLRSGGGRDWHGMAAEPLTAGQGAVAVFSPAAVAVHRGRPEGSPRNVVQGLVAAVEATGTAFRIRLAADPGTSIGLAADVTAEAVADLRLAAGDQVWFSVKTQAVRLYPGAGTRPTATLASRL